MISDKSNSLSEHICPNKGLSLNSQQEIQEMIFTFNCEQSIMPQGLSINCAFEFTNLPLKVTNMIKNTLFTLI